MIVFATNNSHKLSEVRAMLGDAFTVKSLAETGCDADIPETASTLEGNAEIKARWVAAHLGADCCFADDTGLEVDALGGEPGVYSARYAGPGHDSAANMAKLLARMSHLTGPDQRRARFRTVIALLRHGELTLVEGTVEGHITAEPRGTDGFGYDPVFMPDGFNRTFAEMTADEKNAISHRGRALEKLIKLLKNS